MQIINCLPIGRRKKKWIKVDFFDAMPREHPREAKATIELARFSNLPDAMAYANDVANRPGWPPGSYAIVLR
jgi:hypothetical protein